MSEPAPERQRRWAPRRVVVHRIGKKAFLDLLRSGAILGEDPSAVAWRERPRTDLLVAHDISAKWRVKLLGDGWLKHPRFGDVLCLPVRRESDAGQDLAQKLFAAGLEVRWWRSRAKWAVYR